MKKYRIIAQVTNDDQVLWTPALLGFFTAVDLAYEQLSILSKQYPKISFSVVEDK